VTLMHAPSTVTVRIQVNKPLFGEMERVNALLQ
jgi:hypothetical protein